jgi:hypothetical protein
LVLELAVVEARVVAVEGQGGGEVGGGMSNDHIWTEPDFDAPYHQRHALLPNVARCETCAHWMRAADGLCAITHDLGFDEVRRAEDRCLCWSEHGEYEVWVARVLARYPKEPQKRSWETRRA